MLHCKMGAMWFQTISRAMMVDLEGPVALRLPVKAISNRAAKHQAQRAAPASFEDGCNVVPDHLTCCGGGPGGPSCAATASKGNQQQSRKAPSSKSSPCFIEDGSNVVADHLTCHDGGSGGPSCTVAASEGNQQQSHEASSSKSSPCFIGRWVQCGSRPPCVP